MAISKVIYKASAAATPEVWMDATPATAAAADILAPKTAMLADGVVTTGTGTGGGGGSIYQDEDGYIVLDPNGTSGGGAVERKDVNFIDSYDGSIVASYTTAEFANLTELPANPSHTGLTAQGWNIPSSWTLADAKTYITTNKRYDWGQMYTTDDGKTRVYIHLEEGRTSPMLGCCPNGTVDVDWGDGTTHDTLTGTSVSTVKWTSPHNYAAPGDYIIKLTVTGYMRLYGNGNSNQFCGLLRYTSSNDVRNNHYRCAIRKIEIGSGVTGIADTTFYNCYNLTSVTIPNGVTIIGSYAFYNCYNLTSVTIPNGVTIIGSYAFYYCYGLMSITMPNNVTTIQSSALRILYGLTSLALPGSLTIIADYALGSMYGLASLTIPSGVTDIGSSAFVGCSGLATIHFKPTTPPTVANSNAFTNIPTDCIIYVPTGSLADYTTATNYPDSNTYTYVEE